MTFFALIIFIALLLAGYNAIGKGSKYNLTAIAVVLICIALLVPGLDGAIR